MRLDAADLAILELDLEKLDPLARGIAQTLIDRVREDEETVEQALADLEEAREHAKTAGAALDSLGYYIEDAPAEADKLVETIADALDAIEEL